MSQKKINPFEVRSTLRTVLRAVDRHITHVNGNCQWRKEVIARFRASAYLQPVSIETYGAVMQGSTAEEASAVVFVPTAKAYQPTNSIQLNKAAVANFKPPVVDRPISPCGHTLTPAQALALARDWAELANNIARHKDLLLSYNIGLDVDERTKRMVEATARRVGFAMPVIEKY